MTEVFTTRSRGLVGGPRPTWFPAELVAILSNLFNDVAAMFGGRLYDIPEWLPVIEFPWRIAFGTVVTFLVAMCFRTPAAQVEVMRTSIATHA